MTKTKTICLVFGEMGSSKSYLGQKLADDNGLIFLEGDLFCSPSMRAAVEDFKTISPEHIRRLVADLKLQVAYLCAGSVSGVVVSQALYRNQHRQELIDYWTELGFHVEPYWVKIGLWQNLKQLWSRPKGLRWIIYWLKNKPWFQKPTHSCSILENSRRALTSAD